MLGLVIPKLGKASLADRTLEQIQAFKKDPLLVARKNLLLKKNEASLLISKGKWRLGMPMAKTLLKKYLSRSKSNKLTLDGLDQNHIPPFLRSYIRKVELRSDFNALFDWRGSELKYRKQALIKTVKQARKFKHIETLFFSKFLQNHLPKTFQYLPKLKNLTLDIFLDGIPKARSFSKRKLPHLQKLTLKLSEQALDEKKTQSLLGKFCEYFSLQQGLKEFNLYLQNDPLRLHHPLNNLLIHVFQLKNLEKFRFFIQESLLQLLEKPEASVFLNKVEALFLTPYTSQTEEIMLKEKSKSILYISQTLDTCKKSEFLLQNCKNLKSLYLETSTNLSVLENEAYSFPDLAHFWLKIYNIRESYAPKLDNFLLRVEKLQTLDLLINNMNNLTAQEIQKFKKLPCFKTLKSFALEASTRSSFNPSTRTYEDEVFDLDVLRVLELTSLCSLENLTLKFSKKNDITLTDVLNEVSDLCQLKKLEVCLPDSKRGTENIELYPQKLAKLENLRLAAFLAKGDYESLCTQVCGMKALKSLHISNTLFGEARVEPQRIGEILSVKNENRDYLKEIRIEDRFQSVSKIDLQKYMKK